MSIILKDDKLAYIIENKLGNIAQFISIDPSEKIKHVKINNYINNITEISELVEKLLEESRSKAVNIRSFSPAVMKGNKLIYNKTKKDINEIIQHIKQNCSEGKYSIINENIDINDGGVSGVIIDDIIEFSPKDTPKCVEKDGTCLLEKKMGLSILKTIYGFEPEVNFSTDYRVEFSIHPNREGVNQKHTIIWEYEQFNNISHSYKIEWPNNFSKFIGDKTFGLLIAEYLGFNVPSTIVISRNVASFCFGKKTGLFEKWIRTCPITKESGKYYTGNEWTDPFSLMEDEEKKGNQDINIASILSQDAVDAKYSGGAIISVDENNDVIEGIAGNGHKFMMGQADQESLPEELIILLKEIIAKFRSYYDITGEVSIEWVFDGKEVWVVQLNQFKNVGIGNTIVSGTVDSYIQFPVENGLEELRDIIKTIQNKNIGIELIGNVGITSHFGDLLRQSNIPSKIIKNII